MAVSANPSLTQAIEVLGGDFTFPKLLDGMPKRLSDVDDLHIKSFQTSDGVRLTYWEAGRGRPLIFVPGWSGNGAQYIYLLHLLSQEYHVRVLDPRNQGLSDRVDYGTRIARFSMDLKEFVDHLGLAQADFVGHSMGAAILWSFIDLCGTRSIRSAVFVDQPISIYCHSDWSEQQRLEAGGTTTSAERMINAFTSGGAVNSLVTDMKPFERAAMMDSPYFENSESFASEFIKNDPTALALVLFDHVLNDWRDVVRRKVDVPVAIFSGDESNNLASQRWAQSVIKHATLYAYTAKEQGDHFLMFKNPLKFSKDIKSFLELPPSGA